MGDTDVSRASLYGARPPKTQENGIVVQFARWSIGVGQEFLKLTLLAVLVVVLYAPPALALVAATIASASGVFWLFQTAQAYSAGQADLILSYLPALSTSAKISFASLAYLSLLYGFSVLISGMIGHRVQHFYIVPGMILSLGALLAFTSAAYLLIGDLARATGWEPLAFVILFSYIGVNAAVLGLLVTDLRRGRGMREPRAVLPRKNVAAAHRLVAVDAPPIEETVQR